MRSTPLSPDPGAAAGAVGLWSSTSRSTAWLLLTGGVIGWLASFVLTIEKFQITADSSHIPSCSISPILNCGSVMTTPQAAVFGFPNSLLGVTGFAVVAATGAALLAGARLHAWFWSALQFGATAALVLVHWLIVQSLYRIEMLCPYCMIVWAVTIAIFWYVSLRNLAHLLPAARRSPLVSGLLANHAAPLTLWILVILGLIAHQFWWYWSDLL